MSASSGHRRGRRPLLCALLCAVWASGCVKPARQRTTADVVRAVHFEGNGGFLSGQTDYQLRNEMAQADSAFGLLLWPLMYFVEPITLDPELLPQDAYRLEVWYAHNGWFDAEVIGWQVRQIRRRKSFRVGVVDIIGVVDPGPPSLVRAFEINGLNKTSQVLGNEIKRTGYVQPDEQFNLDVVYETRDALLQRLNENSYAYAKVDVEVDAYPEEQAVDVVMTVDQGIPAKFGQITIRGNKKVKRKIIRDSLPMEPGDKYDTRKLSEAQRELFDLGTFSLVSVTPDLSDPAAAEVPVKVTVNEARFRRLRMGVGVEWDVATLTPKVSTEYRQLNILRRLIRLDADASAGYAYALDGAGIGTDGQAIFGLGAGLSIPRFLDPDLTLAMNARYDQELFNGQFPSVNPSVSGSLAYEFSKKVVLQVGGGWEVFELLDLSDAAVTSAQVYFGKGFVDRYRLTSAEVRLTIDERNDPIQPSRGEMYALGLRQSIPLAEDDFLFGEVDLDLRAYRQFRLSKKQRGLPFVLAGRFQTTYLQPWGGSALPYPELAFLGGGSDNRGFRLNQVGDYTCLCTYNGIPGDDGVQATQRYVPEGGRLGSLLATEIRYDWAYDVSFAWFVDTSILSNTIAELSPDRLRVGAGVGARYNSLVGPIRIDVGVRPLYPEDNGPLDYVRCFEESDKIPRAYDLFSQPVGSRGTLSDRQLPLAINLFLAIGEAI